MADSSTAFLAVHYRGLERAASALLLGLFLWAGWFLSAAPETVTLHLHSQRPPQPGSRWTVLGLLLFPLPALLGLKILEAYPPLTAGQALPESRRNVAVVRLFVTGMFALAVPQMVMQDVWSVSQGYGRLLLCLLVSGGLLWTVGRWSFPGGTGTGGR